MAKFKCINQECVAKDSQVITVNEFTIKFNPYTNKVMNIDSSTKEQIVCEYCGKPLESIREFDGFCTNTSFFNSMTSDQKKEVLKKRANKAFDKNVDSMKDYRDAIERDEIKH